MWALVFMDCQSLFSCNLMLWMWTPSSIIFALKFAWLRGPSAWVCFPSFPIAFSFLSFWVWHLLLKMIKKMFIIPRIMLPDNPPVSCFASCLPRVRNHFIFLNNLIIMKFLVQWGLCHFLILRLVAVGMYENWHRNFVVRRKSVIRGNKRKTFLLSNSLTFLLNFVFWIVKGDFYNQDFQFTRRMKVTSW